MIPLTYYISELTQQLEILHQDSCPEPLEAQEHLFHLLESLQAERESLPPTGTESPCPVEKDSQEKSRLPLSAEAELCLLELEAHAELPFSTPSLRRRLLELMEQAQALLLRLPAASAHLRHRLEAALALHLPAA